MKTDALTPLGYLRRELGLSLTDLKALTKEDRDELRDWATEEMRVLDIPVKRPT